MGFCTKEEHRHFLRDCPIFEGFLVSQGIILLKYWLEVSKKEQHKRFLARIEDPSKRWKLSPMDLESHRRWYDYSRARDAMLAATNTPASPWFIVPSDDKKRARLNCIDPHTQQHPVRGDSLYTSEASPTAKTERVRRAEADASKRPAALVGLQHVRASVVPSLIRVVCLRWSR